MTHAELRRLAEAATPGPWVIDPRKRWRICRGLDRVSRDNPIVAANGSTLMEGIDNAAYIAAAHPQTVLGLLDEIERLRGELAAMRAGHGILGSIRGEIK